MKDLYKTCCFCGKQLNSGNNADPLVAPDIDGDYGWCCDACSTEYVIPARKVLGKLDEKEYTKIVPFVQQMPLEELRNALNQDNTLSAFYSFKAKCQRTNHKECFFDVLEGVWGYILPILVYSMIYCIPSLIQLLGFTKTAFIIFIGLIIVTGALFVFKLVQFILALKNQNVDQQSRCIFIWITFGGAALIGTSVAKLVELF